MAICRAHFEVANLAEFVAGLRAHPELEELNGSEKEEGIEFVWKGQRGEETILLGRIVLRGNELLLECNSRGRLACGSELLGEIGRLDNRGEEIKEGEEILKDVVGGRGGESRGEHDELPELPPEAQAYLQEAIRRHYEEWPDHPLPALDGQTPREAAKDRLGRQRLIDLIREMEYMEQRTSSPGHVSYDWNKMRRRLGLAEE